MYMCLVTQKYELAAAKCDISQEPMGITDSSNYYSTIKTQHCTKQASNSNVVYKVSKNCIIHIYHTYIRIYIVTCINCHISLFYRIKFLIMKPL